MRINFLEGQNIKLNHVWHVLIKSMKPSSVYISNYIVIDFERNIEYEKNVANDLALVSHQMMRSMYKTNAKLTIW